jgi:hypothetical protein
MRPRAIIFTMKQTDARITELMSRLTVLDRERVGILAEINALWSMQSEGTAAIKVSGKAGDSIDRNSTNEKKVALFRGLSAAAPMSSPSVGRIVRRGAAATHLPVRMNGSVGFAKSRKSNVRHVQIRHFWP